MVCTPSSRPDVGAQLLLGRSRGRRPPPPSGRRPRRRRRRRAARRWAHERRDRVGHRAAEHAAVDAVVEGADGQHDADQPAQGGREGRLPHGPVGRVGQHDGVGAQLVAVLLEDRRQDVGADLLLALDEDRDARPAGRRRGRAAPRRGPSPRPCRRRRRGRRAGRPARSARTAGCPSRRRRRAAGRRGGRRAAPSARPRARRRWPMTAGRPPSRTISTSRPSARSSSATAVGAGLDVGLVERVERDARDAGQRPRGRPGRPGSRPAPASCRAVSRSGVRTSSVTPASVPTAARIAAAPRRRPIPDRCGTTYSRGSC